MPADQAPEYDLGMYRHAFWAGETRQKQRFVAGWNYCWVCDLTKVTTGEPRRWNGGVLDYSALQFHYTPSVRVRFVESDGERYWSVALRPRWRTAVRNDRRKKN